MIENYLDLRNHVVKRMDRDDISENMPGIMSEALAVPMRMLNFHLSETTMEVIAPFDPTNKMPLPAGFYGMTSMTIDGTRYLPSAVNRINEDSAPRYAISGEFVLISPDVEQGKAIEFCYRSFLRGGEAGEGVSIDRLNEIFLAYPDLNMRPRYDTGETLPETIDVHGRADDIDTDKIVGTLDHIDFYHNPVNRLIRQYPDVFIYSALSAAYDFVQDFDAADRYAARLQGKMNEAQQDMIMQQFGQDKLAIRPRASFNRVSSNGYYP